MKSSMTKLATALAAMVACGSAMAGGVGVVGGGAGVGGLGGITGLTTSFNVEATVAPGCVVGSATTMSFGTLKMLDTDTGGLSANTDTATADFNATCTNGTLAPQLKFTSQNSTGTGFRMIGDTDVMSYSLRDNNGTPIAHDTFAQFADLVANGTLQKLSVTGVIAPSDKAAKAIGTYGDTVTIAVTFTP